jgi:hypothetical protein
MAHTMTHVQSPTFFIEKYVFSENISPLLIELTLPDNFYATSIEDSVPLQTSGVSFMNLRGTIRQRYEFFNKGIRKNRF